MNILFLYNSLSQKKEVFTPLDPHKIRLYVCGPTVYDYPHIGNARAVVIYDVLFRLLKSLYGEANIVYARNITDIDDKIIAKAMQSGKNVTEISLKYNEIFQQNMGELHAELPNHQPKATEAIGEMIKLIGKLIENNHAYLSQGHVYYDVSSFPAYNLLSGRKLEELVAGARIEPGEAKKSPHDFVLWKPAKPGDLPDGVFDSPWGAGRPGWHIECSAMSTMLLGPDFDIHGGGADLKFPHHSNEIAQSCGAYPGSHFAKYWLHNGFVTVNGEKMSKSLGNFLTVTDLLNQGERGEVIRLALLSTHYRKPLDWQPNILAQAKATLDSFYRVLKDASVEQFSAEALPSMPLGALLDDLNLPLYLAQMHDLAKQFHKAADDAKSNLAQELWQAGRLIGIFNYSPADWFKNESSAKNNETSLNETEILDLIAARQQAKDQKLWQKADEIRQTLAESGVYLEDKPNRQTIWYRK